MKNIAVLLGGKSSEKPVSKKSGAAAINALRTNKEYNIFRCDPANKNEMEEFIKLCLEKKIDVVLNMLHGEHGEDGEIQGFLQTLEIPYTGPSIHGAAIAMDKISTKRVLRSEHIPLADEISFEKLDSGWRIAKNEEEEYVEEINKKTLENWSKKLAYPVFAKAAREGSSFGVYQLKTTEEFIEKLSEMTAEYNRILVEPRLSGNEVTCSVFDGKALEITEIVAEKGEFYDYESKYAGGGSTHYMPPRDILPETSVQFKKIAEKIGFLLDLNCAYRVDGFIDGENFWIMEINTLPGMTATSLLPEAYCFATKNEFSDLCEKMIQNALKKN